MRFHACSRGTLEVDVVTAAKTITFRSDSVHASMKRDIRLRSRKYYVIGSSTASGPISDSNSEDVILVRIAENPL